MTTTNKLTRDNKGQNEGQAENEGHPPIECIYVPRHHGQRGTDQRTTHSTPGGRQERPAPEVSPCGADDEETRDTRERAREEFIRRLWGATDKWSRNLGKTQRRYRKQWRCRRRKAP